MNHVGDFVLSLSLCRGFGTDGSGVLCPIYLYTTYPIICITFARLLVIRSAGGRDETWSNQPASLRTATPDFANYCICLCMLHSTIY